jgi:hypothetical protein
MVRVAAFLQMEDIEKDDYVIEYVGKIEHKRRENNYGVVQAWVEHYITSITLP